VTVAIYLPELRSLAEYFSIILRFGCVFLKKALPKVRYRPAVRDRRSRTDELAGDGGPDEAVAFIAETLPGLARLAKRHRLDVLAHLLGMTQMEAEEHLRVRSRRKLS
jgi:hypothetical protein